MPGHAGDRLGQVLDGEHLQARGDEQALVLARRSEVEVADRAADRELLGADEAR